MYVLGIDLSKRTFDATLITPTAARHHRRFTNNAKGFDQLQRWLRRFGGTQVHACMEATNVYWEALAQFLIEQQHTVSVVNPARIKGFAQCEMQRNKTDKQDSLVIATFCARHTPDAWVPPTPDQQRLRALVRHREDLLQTRLQQQNRLRDTHDPLVRESLQAVLTTLEAQLRQVDEQIRAHLATQTELQATMQVMTTIVGIGTLTATKLLAEFYDLTRYQSAKALAADAGVTPTNYESGTSVRRRATLSKMGKASIRAALYMPALTAMRCCPAFQQFAARLAARGKPKPVIIGAVMRKLLHILYGVVKHQTPYDPDKVLGRAASTAA